MQIDRKYLTDLLIRMVQIKSTNPALTPDGTGEAALGQFIFDQMEEIGLEAQLYPLEEGRVNVAGRLRGAGGGPALLLNGHMDTVGVTGMQNPFSGEVRDGRVYGRGSQDMKGSLAAMMAAAKAIVDAGNVHQGDIWITAVADEEFASIGAQDLVKRIRADAAIVTEPTDMNICRAHRGFIWYEVETIGRAAHGSRYLEGIDANIRMGRFLAELDWLERRLRKRNPHPLAGPPSLHAPLLRGGTEPSIYAARCELKIERRTMPGEVESEVTRELSLILDRLSEADPTFRATIRPSFMRLPFEVSAEAHIVRLLDEVVAERRGRPAMHVGQTFWTDAAFFAAAGMETVLIGPVGSGLHSAEEWVDLESLFELADILGTIAIRYGDRSELSDRP